MKRVNLGCGNDIKDGFLNIDDNPVYARNNYICWDLRKGLLPECEGADLFTSSHMLEHLYLDEAYVLIDRCFRALKSGGVFHAGIPNFKGLLQAYLNDDWSYILPPMMAFAPHGSWAEVMTYGIFNSPDDPHKSFWDVEHLIQVLEKTGFIYVGETSFDPELDVNTELRRKYTNYVIGVKP